MIDFSCFLEYSCSCSLLLRTLSANPRISLWGVSFIVDLNFCSFSFIYSSAQSASISSPNSQYYCLTVFFPDPLLYKVRSTIYLNADLLHLDCIDKICHSTCHQLRFNFHFSIALQIYVRLALPGSHKPCANYSQKYTTHLSPSI